MSSDRKPNSDVIEHYGIKGMRWGVRKDKAGSGTSRDAKSLDKAGRQALKVAQKNWVKTYNAMADESSVFCKKINDRYEQKYGKDWGPAKNPNSKEAKQYYDDHAAAVTESLQRHSDRLIGSKIDSRVKVTWYIRENGAPSYYVEPANRAEHASGPGEDDIVLDIEFDDLGRIVSFSLPDQEAQREFNTVEDVIMHYGIKGMRWGVRKDQVAAREAAAREARTLSDKELRARINRLDMEKRYVNLVSPTSKNPAVEEGSKFVKNLLLEAGKEVAKPFVVAGIVAILAKVGIEAKKK